MDLIRLPSLEDFLYENELDKDFQDFIDVCEARGRIANIESKPRIDEIKKAIKERYYVGIYYEEPDPDQDERILAGFRLIEPYVYGRGYKYGDKISNSNRQYIRGYVIRDTKTESETKNRKNFVNRKSVSRSKRKPYWRLFRVDRIQIWQTIPRKVLGFRKGYNPNDQMIARVIIAVNKSDFSKGEVKA